MGRGKKNRYIQLCIRVQPRLMRRLRKFHIKSWEGKSQNDLVNYILEKFFGMSEFLSEDENKKRLIELGIEDE